ncbi:MAG: hypothetical protein NUV44_09355 [Candidatus Scalindua sp.]|nr:hypothetical protein [Candidatus Scalindua sp.]
MIIGEGEKIKSIPLKHILIFVGLVVCAGLIFRFGFMKIFHNMNKNHVYRKEEAKTDVLIPVVHSKSIGLIGHSNMFKIIGIIEDHYIVKTRKGLKKVRISGTDKKNINDEIKIEKL